MAGTLNDTNRVIIHSIASKLVVCEKVYSVLSGLQNNITGTNSSHTQYSGHTTVGSPHLNHNLVNKYLAYGERYRLIVLGPPPIKNCLISLSQRK